ncbi:type I-C CRISPR-associated protein Cas7/Csd2 [Cohnella laeviribosi]|uniref:type I-C CRISPR-associated protein Cas7/Csd2 n=1 Tax=Cohnella laeviribosi TaxID=380174 RepID=UPI003D1A87E0
MALKRKVGDFVKLTWAGEAGYNIYVTEGGVLNEQHRKAYRAIRPADADSKELKPKDAAEAQELTRWMCANFFDIRTFGAVMTTKVNTGQVRGPVQFTFARSIDPIFSQEVTITRQAVTQEGAEKDREMGRKHVIPYALYRMDGYISAYLAGKTGFSEDDLSVLWEALMNLFEHDRSASRGQMAVRKLVAFEHSTALGQAPAHVLLERVSVRKKTDAPARSFSDYELVIDREGLPEGVELVERG